MLDPTGAGRSKLAAAKDAAHAFLAAPQLDAGAQAALVAFNAADALRQMASRPEWFYVAPDAEQLADMGLRSGRIDARASERHFRCPTTARRMNSRATRTKSTKVDEAVEAVF